MKGNKPRIKLYIATSLDGFIARQLPHAQAVGLAKALVDQPES